MTEQNERLTALETRLAAAERRLQEVDDIQQVHNLQRTYGYYLDDGRWDDVLALLTDDCTVEINKRGVYVGKKQAEVFFKNVLKGGPETGYFGSHLMMQGVVHVAPGGCTAQARYQLLIQIGIYQEAALWLGGVYENEFRKVNGRWQISKLHWYVKYTATYEEGWAKAVVPPFEPSSEFPPDLPPSVDYEPYPGHFFAPYHFKNPITGE